MGHSHNWGPYAHGQEVCRGCGQVRNGKHVRGIGRVLHVHSYPVGRRGSIVTCQCGHSRRVG